LTLFFDTASVRGGAGWRDFTDSDAFENTRLKTPRCARSFLTASIAACFFSGETTPTGPLSGLPSSGATLTKTGDLFESTGDLFERMASTDGCFTALYGRLYSALCAFYNLQSADRPIRAQRATLAS
jgi:hypothetical protein